MHKYAEIIKESNFLAKDGIVEKCDNKEKKKLNGD